MTESQLIWALIDGKPFKCVYINESGTVIDTASPSPSEQETP